MLALFKRTYFHVLGTGVAIVMASTFMACSFNPPGISDPKEKVHYGLNSAPYVPITEGQRWVAYDDPGKFRAVHGFSCAQASRAATSNTLGLRIREAGIQFPSKAFEGTVFLNGWRAEYLGSNDHEVLGLGSAIFNITRVYSQGNLTLHWDAGGVLSDKNGDDPYRWCYRYTVVFWNRDHIDFDDIPNDTDDPAKNYDLTFTKFDSTNNAVHPLPGSYTDTLHYGPPRAVLPRGYGMWWRSGDDHHVLHVGFDLGRPSTSGNTINWTSTTLLKDNSTARPYEAASLVSVLSGNSARMWQPSRVRVLTPGSTTWKEVTNAWLLDARSPTPCPSNPKGGSKLYHFSVSNVPFDHAVPVLSAWDVGNVCDDTHVKRIGASIEDFDYLRDPDTGTGTMVYTIASVFEDEGHPQQSAERFKVTILGFNSLAQESAAALQ